jgi:hypothetical protein
MSKTSLTEDWLRLSTGSLFLMVESAAVISLRSMLFLTRDPRGRDEAVRMVAEKFQANIDLAAKFATNGARSPSEAALLSVNHYGSLVRANRKRLLDQRMARKLAGR